MMSVEVQRKTSAGLSRVMILSRIYDYGVNRPVIGPITDTPVASIDSLNDIGKYCEMK